MKTGAIVYVAGSEKMKDDFAWWMLLAKGMRRIVCLIAEVVNGSELKLTGRELRIWG